MGRIQLEMSTETLRARLREGRSELRARDAYTEEDTRSVLISPFLDALGYDIFHQKLESQDRGNTPDVVVYAKPPGQSRQSHARLILEAKPLGTDFDSGPSRTETPERQLKRYLRNHIASGPNTFGLLTDGERYRVFQRTGHLTDLRFIGEFDVLEETPEDQSDVVDQLRKLLGRDALASLIETKPESIRAARGLAGMIKDPMVNSNWLLNLLVTSSRTCESISVESLSGRAKDACEIDWMRADWRPGPRIETTQPDLEGSRLVTGVVDFKPQGDDHSRNLARRDVALAATVIARQSTCRTGVIIARHLNSDGLINSARVAVHYQGRTAMTYEFDPFNPPVSVLKSIERVIKRLQDAKPVAPQKLIDAVAAKTIRKEFYLAVAGWLELKQAGRGQLYRQSILRHLIRAMFAWILKEDGILPIDPFDESFAKLHDAIDYHNAVLMFMFYKRLNVPEIDRVSHRVDTIDEVLSTVPFLNGSLFAEHAGDSDLDLSYDDYFGVKPDRPGLFTIMSRYDWTTDEHMPGESDQTIDPEMLSNLFENLFAASESEETLSKMPKGTYYTPSDVVMEMVKDALSTAVRNNLPGIMLGDRELLELFDDVEHEPLILPATDAKRIVETLLRLSIFDPSVGSGAFLLTTTYAIRNAVRKLDAFAENPTRHVIQNQLHALDINPMAVQITRLRLFIAIMAAERIADEREPLPNLEGRVVCADTLSTFAIPTWHTEISTDLAGTSPELLDALRDRAGVFRAWRNAHTDSEKATVKAQDDAVRKRIMAELRFRGIQDQVELNSFARHKLLSTDNEPISTDARLLFYQPEWKGFDIVIGNPPYETIAQGKAATERDAVRNRLRDSLHYRTTRGGDLYNLFCELALSLVRQADGVVTLIVPISLAAGTHQVETRKLFERRSKHIWLRNHDVRPGKIFHDSPVTNPESRQRVTIVTAVTGSSDAVIDTTGTMKWGVSEREPMLQARSYTRKPVVPEHVRPELVGQWPRVPSGPIALLLDRMMSQKRTVQDLAARHSTSHALAIPNTAFYFVTVSPAEVMERVETVTFLESSDAVEIAMAALNGHVGFMWWTVWSDGLNLTRYQIDSMPIPDKWIDREEVNDRARSLGRSLIDAVNHQNIERNRTGTAGRIVENVNFYTACPEVISEIDELYLESVGMLEQDLLEHLRTLRSPSNWRLK